LHTKAAKAERRELRELIRLVGDFFK